jgi:phosphatidylserine/phosphatidylglycerophosphate/cardiolipin synthase-like enzyme
MTGWTTTATGPAGELTFVVHRGDRAVLMAMDLPHNKIERLAGFALFRKSPGGSREPLLNRLDFKTPITTATTPEQRKWHPSDKAPFQKFRWVDVPSDFKNGDYEYSATAIYFAADGSLTAGDSASVTLDVSQKPATNLTVGFTRGYMSSQAYADKFHNAPIEPPGKKSIDFDTKPFQKQYAWLGFHARELIASFLAECVADNGITVDVFAYDLNEPDTIGALKQLGSRLRLYLDNADLHIDHAPPGSPRHALETDAEAAIAAAGGKVKRGHFRRFAHSKVFIARRNGTAFKVLTGSTNFSLRGLYVQANNVLVFDSPVVAGWFETAFETAWTNAGGFDQADIAKHWFELPADGLPAGAIAFSPHTSGDVSLKRVADAITAAGSSLLFSVMGLAGGGDVLKQLREGTAKSGMFSYGVTQSSTYMRLYKPGSATPVTVPYAYLKDKVPQPFRAEISGGPGQVIHDKFVVVDFNGPNPIVYTGSSNLAAGGEKDNGDNLIELRGADVASLYMVDAVRQIDHFHFRAAMKDATKADPLVLKGPTEWHKWVDPYYDPNDLKFLDRELFARSG